MLRTYLYIPEQLGQRIYHTAKMQKKSRAEVMRLALENGINSVSQQGSASALVLLKLAALGKRYTFDGPKDSSMKMDKLLWGKDWSRDE